MSIMAARSHVYAALAITTGIGTWLQQREQVLTCHHADILVVDNGEDGMDSGVGLEPVSRKVLAVGIPRPGLGLDRAPGPRGATACASEVSRAFGTFGYVECHRQGEDRDLAEEIRRALTSDRTDVLVVHIAGHGKLSQFGELHVIGSDGKLLDDPVSYWIKLIESHPDKPRPLTLFVLDLCYMGAAAALSQYEETPTEQRRAWVIAATSQNEIAFDYRLSRATATVLNRYRSGVLRVNPLFEYIPLEAIAHEIRREVAVLSREGIPPSLEASRIPLNGSLSHLTFFRNPLYPWPAARASAGTDGRMASILNEARRSDLSAGSSNYRIFLCHSSGDKRRVRRLYHRLREEGFDPWLDEENIVAGQDWDAEIKKAIRATDLVIEDYSGTSHVM
jgi:hypothetical protein